MKIMLFVLILSPFVILATSGYNEGIEFPPVFSPTSNVGDFQETNPPIFGGPNLQSNVSGLQPSFEAAPGVEVTASVFGPSLILPDFGEIEDDELVLGFIGPTLFSKVGDPEQTLAPLCPDVDAITKKVDEALNDKDLKSMCAGIESSVMRCKSARQSCDNLKALTTTSDVENVVCPPNAAKLVQACETRLERRGVDELAESACEELWRSNQDDIDESCAAPLPSDGYPEGTEPETVDSETPNTGVLCPEPFIPFTCPDGSQAQPTGQVYPFDHNVVTCELYVCPNQTTAVAPAEGDECPSQPTCNVGSPALSGSFQKASGRICPAYECIVAQQTATAPVDGVQTQRPSAVSGLAVGVNEAIIEASSPEPLSYGQRDYCTKLGFMTLCIGELKEEALVNPNLREDFCKFEATSTSRYLEQHCEEREKQEEQKDVYISCIEQSEKSCEEIEKAFEKCTASTNRQNIREVIKRKAKIECSRRSLGEPSSGYEKVISTLEALELEAASQEDLVQLSVTRDKMIDSADELEKIKRALKWDIFRDILTLLGLNAAQLKESSQKQRQFLTELETTRSSLKEICTKVSSEDKAACNKSLELFSNEIQAGQREAAATESKAEGVIGVVSKILAGS
ncbi:hypothetical protein HY571_01360 [Candidatus Micrarchaeota archaeon]|nr:hypothetical protein [Candidatus Micrarchaeota archaeon]